ncbi:MAG: DUF2518 family protein [Alkalinema sp. RU_4_3]|nr:DUF2518 family protein [Alkalinema sp. RU_4_3]
MFSTVALQTYAQWIAILGGVLTLVTIVAWIASWGIRYRLVGITSFTFVVAASVFALGLGLFQRTAVPGSVAYARVFDTDTDRIVISLPATIRPDQLDATLRQAASDLFSPGRASSTGVLTVRARTVLHPQAGISLPLYLGEARRSLSSREDENMAVEFYQDNIALLPKADAS